MKTELIYDRACPNVESARAQLLRAFAIAGIAPRWQEWEARAAETPAHARGFGSPTILVDGRDVAGGTASGGEGHCRIYSLGADGPNGVPAVADIVRALKSGQGTARGAAGWSFNGAVLPAIGLSLLPKLTCPACWPAYAGLLSSFGVGFFDYTPYLLPLTAVFLLIAIAGLAFRAHSRRGYRPLLLGLVGSAILLAGKFGYDSDHAMYAGIAALVAASIWNTWPKAPAPSSDRSMGPAHGSENCCSKELNGGTHGRETTH